MQSSRLNLFFGESSSTLLLIRHPNEFGTDSEQSSVTDIIFLAVKFLYIVEWHCKNVTHCPKEVGLLFPNLF